jgi:hypothetical protein
MPFLNPEKGSAGREGGRMLVEGKYEDDSVQFPLLTD